jgi:ribonuclease HI
VKPNSQYNVALRIPGSAQSNQVGEIAAVIHAAANIPTFWPLLIVTDSKYVIEGLTVHLLHWENKGWINVENTNFFKMAAYLLRRRSAPMTFKWVKGHNRDLGKEQSDKLAKEGTEKDAPDIIPLDIPTDFDLQGAKLAMMTQAIAYRGVCNKNTTTHRQSTLRNLETAKQAIRNFNNLHKTDSSIWNNTRKKSIRPKVQQFLFKSLHNTYMISSFWSHIPGYKTRGQCQLCQTTEDLNHILTQCSAEPVNTLWTLARSKWPHLGPHSPEQWPEITLGTILGCGSLTVPKPERGNANEN